jgi:YedE family putative selenium metabolism protein
MSKQGQYNWRIHFPILVIVSGVVVGVVAGILSAPSLLKLWDTGNPGNMGVCMVCFVRDIAGALGLHRSAGVQYLRPEIFGLIIGAFLTSLFTREMSPRSGSSPALRFVLGAFVMIGALVFLGCPTRMVLRLGGGDGNALPGLAGFVAGIAIGAVLLKRGASLGPARKEKAGVAGWIMPLLAAGGMILLFTAPGFIFFSIKGSGSEHAPVLVSLGAGILIGALGQRSRMCFAGGIRDMILFRSPHLLVGFVAVFLGVLAINLLAGNFNPGFTTPPGAHSVHLWNFLGMLLVGLASVLLGGCPFRQLILSAQGNGDSAVAVFGMLTGAGIAHNFGLTASGKGVPEAGMAAVIAGIAFCIVVGLLSREKQ